MSVSPPPVVLAGSERASWVRTATASRGLIFAFVGLELVISAAEIFVVLRSDGRLWWVALVPVVALLAVLSSFAWTIRIDARGVTMRSSIGIPRISIPLSDIETAGVVRVQAFAEYGGWGFRWNLQGRMGIILRSGEALEVRRKKGVSIVITVDDATTAAALIIGLVQRQATVA